MAQPASQWIHVGAFSGIPAGEAKAVRLGDGRSVALFNVDARIYATDNQCPHTGYPLIRGAIRQGVITCDWHGRSFDLEGGGCFNSECDDLQTFSVDIRQDEIWIQPGDGQYKRRAKKDCSGVCHDAPDAVLSRYRKRDGKTEMRPTHHESSLSDLFAHIPTCAKGTVASQLLAGSPALAVRARGLCALHQVSH